MTITPSLGGVLTILRRSRQEFIPDGAVPATLYLCLLLIIPLSVLVTYSFWKADFFSVTRTFTLENYAQLIDSPIFLVILRKSRVTSLAASAIAVSIAYQIAYAVVFKCTL